jgi:hypothetical protein
VPFGLREFADLLYECERFPEVPQTEGPLDPMCVIKEAPFACLGEQSFRCLPR